MSDVLHFTTGIMQQTPNKEKVVNVRIAEDDLRKIQELASSEERSVSGHIRWLIRKDLQEREMSWSQ